MTSIELERLVDIGKLHREPPARQEAALRWHGYRSDTRYLVFQALAHTLGTPTGTWRLPAKCHDRRNRVTYEGFVEIEERLLEDLVAAAGELEAAVGQLGLLDIGSGEEPSPI